MRRLIDTAEERATAILKEHAGLLEAIADLLIREETIEHDELEALFEGPRPTPHLVGPASGRPATSAPATPPATDERSERDRPSGGALRPQPAG